MSVGQFSSGRSLMAVFTRSVSDSYHGSMAEERVLQQKLNTTKQNMSLTILPKTRQMAVMDLAFKIDTCNKIQIPPSLRSILNLEHVLCHLTWQPLSEIPEIIEMALSFKMGSGQ